MTSRIFVVALSASLVAAQGRQRPIAMTDPATDLVRVRAFLTTTSGAVDLTIDGAEWANAASPDPTYRVIIDGATVHVTRTTSDEADIPLSIILASVRAHTTVGWTVSPVEPGSSTLEIANFNASLPRPVDRFAAGPASSHFTTSADLLREDGPLGPIPNVRHHLTLAFFYPWWSLDSWSLPTLIDNPVPPSSTSDPADLRRMMTTAKGRGLDAFVMSWPGKDFDGGIDHQRMLRCLDAARTTGFKMAALLETPGANPQHVDGLADPVTVRQWLEDIVDSYTSDPAYLSVDGRPVVFAYAAQRLSQAGWTDALARLRASGRDVLLVGEGINATRTGAFDGQFFYASNQFQGPDIETFDRGQSLNVRTYHLLPGDAIGRRIWVATVSPGYDDTHLNDGRVPRVTSRDGGNYYGRQWRAAIDNSADWIVITSWNEYLENTEIESTRLYGDRYLALTQSWSAAFRAANPVAIPRSR